MEQLIAHLLGDYVLQNHWMANNKTKHWEPAAIHVLLYSLPFTVFFDLNLGQWLAIVLTHYLIDRYRLASYWVDFWGTGKEGWLTAAIMRARDFEFADGVWRRLDVYAYARAENENRPMPEGIKYEERPVTPDAPAWLGVWLLIIVDNTMHLCINYAALRWLA